MHTIFHLKCKLLYVCTVGVSVSLDQPHTPDSWPISEPLLLTNKISKPIIYVLIHECHLVCPPCCHIPRSLYPWKERKRTFLDTNGSAHFLGIQRSWKNQCLKFSLRHKVCGIRATYIGPYIALYVLWPFTALTVVVYHLHAVYAHSCMQLWFWLTSGLQTNKHAG